MKAISGARSIDPSEPHLARLQRTQNTRSGPV